MLVSVDLLILGAGWTSQFLIPLCKTRGITYVATTRSGREDTLLWEFDPDSDDVDQYNTLPDASTVLITFPITKKGSTERLVRLYSKSRSESRLSTPIRFIQLGATSIWDLPGGKHGGNAAPEIPPGPHWFDRHSPTLSTPRGEAEQELLLLSDEKHLTTVLDLAGLWGGSRSMKNWVDRVAPTKDVLQNKSSLHMIHGDDVARAILAVHQDFEKAAGQRWLLTDGRVYDWWDLASAWGRPSTEGSDEGRGPHAAWVQELMNETGVRALPRDVSLFSRALDSREFWTTFSLTPVRARLD